MVITFNRKDLGDFGRYVLSPERTKRIVDNYSPNDNVTLDERLREIYHADVENFIASKKFAAGVDESEVYISLQEDITGDLGYDKQHFWLDVPTAIEAGYGYLRCGDSLYQIVSENEVKGFGIISAQ